MILGFECPHGFVDHYADCENVNKPECEKCMSKAKLISETLNGLFIGKWISVEDRLPDVDERVLVFGIGIYDGFIGDTVIAITSMKDKNPLFPSLKIGKEWRSPWQYFFTDYKVTHWMFLPEPPKEE